MVGVLVTDVLVAIRCGRHSSRLLRDVLLLYFEVFDLQTLKPCFTSSFKPYALSLGLKPETLLDGNLVILRPTCRQ